MDCAASGTRATLSLGTCWAPALDSGCGGSESAQGRRPCGCWSRPRSEGRPSSPHRPRLPLRRGCCSPPTSGAVPPPRQPWPLGPDLAPQCRDSVPAAAQPPTSAGRRPPRPHPFRPSGNEVSGKCSRGAQSAPPTALQQPQVSQYHPTLPPHWLSFSLLQ